MTARSIIFSIAAAAAAIGSAQVAAAPASLDGRPSVSVSYADLDLGAEAGRATLKSRIVHAGKRVCRIPGENETKAAAARSSCFKEAMKSANLQVQQAVATRLAAADSSPVVAGTR